MYIIQLVHNTYNNRAFFFLLIFPIQPTIFFPLRSVVIFNEFPSSLELSFSKLSVKKKWRFFAGNKQAQIKANNMAKNKQRNNFYYDQVSNIVR